MPELLTFLKQVGAASMDLFWFPLLLWTTAALAIRAVLKAFDRTDVLFQYHIRVALIASLPAGLLISVTAGSISKLLSASAEAPFSLIVIQNPITVSGTPDNSVTAAVWSDPNLILGILTSFVALIAFIMVGRLVRNYSRLYAANRKGRLFSPKERLNGFSGLDGATLEKCRFRFSDRTDIPYTFGWKQPVIVIPSFLKGEPSKLALAVRHEQMHIRRGDYMINTCILFIKSLFWFHPLIHLIYRDIKVYREISCDSEVLADRRISRKQYARFLFELAGGCESNHEPVVSMSINKSTLKKRIHTMTRQKADNRPIRKSVIFSLTVLIAISVLIACSDLQSTGFTNEDLAKTQHRIEASHTGEQPLYVINGEISDQQEAKSILVRIKPKYIKAVDVLKGRQATEKYGDRGRHGVIELKLLNKEKAITDLLDQTPGGTSQTDPPSEPFYVIAEQMPKLIGGLKSIQENIHYPEDARNQGIQGRVIVQFIVNEQGKVENPQIVKGIGGGCDKEAVRVVKTAEFEPGMQEGEPVRVQYSLPIVYRL